MSLPPPIFAQDDLPPETLVAGAASGDITPKGGVFLFGYPHVPRISTSVHDALLCSALYLRNGDRAALFLAHDLIFVPRGVVVEARRRIAAVTGLSPDGIMLTATHTHSGPLTADQLSNTADPVVPAVDRDYLASLLERIVATACRAVERAVPAEIGLHAIRVQGMGGNRHDPDGPADRQVPVLIARTREGRVPIGCMLVHAMHPTVLHEDSTCISGDFPHFTRAYLQQRALGPDCPVLFHQGASGDQSPRHVTRANTLAEARRLGEALGCAIAVVLPEVAYHSSLPLLVRQCWIELQPRTFPSAGEAERALAAARERYATLKNTGAAAATVRTAECDVFGAEETAELARAAVDGRLRQALEARTPAEIQAITVGPWTFVGWPGEFFVEYALAVRNRRPGAFVISLANGELQGYIVTPDAAARGAYEAGNAVFAPENGQRFVDATVALLA